MPRMILALAIACAFSLSAHAQGGPEPVWENTVPVLRGAVEKDPENIGLRVRFTLALLHAGKETTHPDAASARLKEAHDNLDRILQQDPRAIIPLRVRTLESYLNRKYEDTVTFGRRLLEVTPRDAEVSRHVLKALVQLGRHEEAAGFLVDWSLEGTTPSFGFLQGLISTLVLKPEFRDAFGKKLDDAAASQADDVYFVLVRAIFLAETGRVEGAWQLVHEAEAKGLCDTRTAARHTFVTTLKGRAPEYSQAMANYDGLDLEGIRTRSASNPEHAGLMMRKARLLDMAGRSAEAFEAYAAVRKLNPSYWAAWYRPGELLLQEKEAKPAEALALLETAHRLAPAFLPGVVVEADAAVRAGQADKAIALLVELARRVEPNLPDPDAKSPRESVRTISEVIGGLVALEEGAAGGRLIAALQKAAGAEPANPFLPASLAIAHHAMRQATEARAAAVKAERTGLAGREGWPSAVLFAVFGKPTPKIDAAAENANSR